MARLLIYLKPYFKKVNIKVPCKVSDKAFVYYIIKLGYRFYWLSIKPFKLSLLSEMEVSPPVVE